MKKLITILSLVLLIAGCATEEKYQAVLNTWMGSTKSNLVNTWGVPSSSYKVDEHEELIAYNRSVSGFNQYGSYNYYCTTTFTIRDDEVVNWKYSGNSCVAE